MWMPWEPVAYKTGRVEYLEEELNKLMHEKTQNEIHAKNEFDNRIKDAKLNAIKDNVEKAEKSGNVLTQTINSDGNLVNVGNVNSSEANNEKISVADLRQELFEGENVVTKMTDHGLGQLTATNEVIQTGETESKENTENTE
jgi:hypothetical protein